MAETVTNTRGMTAQDMLEALVRIPSLSGKEQAAVAFMQDVAHADGFTVHADRAGNFIAETPGTGPTIMFLGHIDTFPGHIPVRRDEHVLWGRGSVDAKGPLVAAYCAARRHMDAHILVVGTVDEEGHSRGAWNLDVPEPHWIINGEPSNTRGITIGYRGIVRGDVRCRRDVGHAGHPGAGAIDRVIHWWNAVQAGLPIGEGFKDATARMDTIKHQGDGLSETCTARFQVRLPPSVSPDELQTLAEQAAEAHGIELRITEALPAATGSRRSDLVAVLSSSIREAGVEPRVVQKTGTSDMNVAALRWPDVPCVAYGPGDPALDHTPTEHIELTDLATAIEVLADAFARLRQL